MAGGREKAARVPPRWVVVGAWHVHRALYRVTAGRFGLWRPRPGKWGTLRLTTTGRRSGQPRAVILGYVEDGPNLVTLAMNGWGEGEPAWWLNLLAHPDAEAVVRSGQAAGEEKRASPSPVVSWRWAEAIRSASRSGTKPESRWQS